MYAGSSRAARRSATREASVGGTAVAGAATGSSTANSSPSSGPSSRRTSSGASGSPPQQAAGTASRSPSRLRCGVTVPGAAASQRAACAGASSRAEQAIGRCLGDGARGLFDEGQSVVVGPVHVLEA